MTRALWNPEQLRQFENEVAEAFNQGCIRAPVHLYDGNEAQILGVFENVRHDDWVFCSWRSHYQCLLKGVPREEVFDEILVGNSISLSFPEFKIYSSAIVGGVLPIATGVALGLKQQGETDDHVWCFMGDMTSETGIANESIKYAEAFDLPITFVIEDNNLSVVTNTRETWGLKHLTFERPNKSSKVIYYSYTSRYPHAGAGKRINF